VLTALTATPHTWSGLRKLIHQLHRPQDDISLISRSRPNAGIAPGVIGIFRHRAMKLQLHDIQLVIVDLTIAQLIIFQESEVMITGAEIAPQGDQPSHSAIGVHAYHDQESLR
jgi:hypothetical protein